MICPSHYSCFRPLAGAAFGLCAALLMAAGPLAAEPLPLTVLSIGNDTTAGFLVGADKDTIHVSLEPTGASTFKIPIANIQSMNIEEPKAWGPAMAAFQSGNYAEAARQFDALAQTFASIVPLKDSYGSLARLYHFMALRELGRYEELAALMDRQLATPLTLSEFYLDEYEDLQGWALLGKKDWLSLGSYVKRYEEDQTVRIVPQPPFKRMRSKRMANVAYLRAVWNEQQEKNPDHAILDYHRAMTLDLGSDVGLTVKSAQAALRLMDAKIQKAPQDRALLGQAYSLAVICRDFGGPSGLSQPFAKYLEYKPPEVPKAAEPEKPAAAAAAPAAKAGEPAKPAAPEPAKAEEPAKAPPKTKKTKK